MAKKRTAVVIVPSPVKHDSRICFGINFYATEAEADVAALAVKQRGDTYNGGYFHGMSCGRDKTWDHTDPVLGKLFAVTVG